MTALAKKSDDALPAPRSLTIKGLVPTLPERGRIKIGRKGAARPTQDGKREWQPPQKLDHFLITTMQRGPDGNFIVDAELHKHFGEKPVRLPVRLLFDDIAINFQSRYVAYKGTKMWCTGDGQVASRMTPDEKSRQEVQCPCPRAEMGYKGSDRCKINGRLSVLIEHGAVGGVWVFRTTSYWSVIGIMSSLALMKRATGGPLSGLQLDMVLNPKVVVSPDTGQNQTVYVVSLEYRGTMQELESAGARIVEDRARRRIHIAEIEKDAMRLLAAPADDTPFPGETAAEVVQEFYPEQAAAESGASIAPQAPAEGAGKLDRLEQAMQAEPPKKSDLPPLEPTAPPVGQPPVQRRVPTKREGTGTVADWDAFYAQAEADVKAAPNPTWLAGWLALHTSALKNMKTKRKDLADQLEGLCRARLDELKTIDPVSGAT